MYKIINYKNFLSRVIYPSLLILFIIYFIYNLLILISFNNDQINDLAIDFSSKDRNIKLNDILNQNDFPLKIIVPWEYEFDSTETNKISTSNNFFEVEKSSKSGVNSKTNYQNNIENELTNTFALPPVRNQVNFFIS